MICSCLKGNPGEKGEKGDQGLPGAVVSFLEFFFFPQRFFSPLFK